MKIAQGMQRVRPADSRAWLTSHPVHLENSEDRGRIAALEAAMAELLQGGQEGAIVPVRRGKASRGVRAEDLDGILERLVHAQPPACQQTFGHFSQCGDMGGMSLLPPDKTVTSFRYFWQVGAAIAVMKTQFSLI